MEFNAALVLLSPYIGSSTGPDQVHEMCNDYEEHKAVLRIGKAAQSADYDMSGYRKGGKNVLISVHQKVLEISPKYPLHCKAKCGQSRIFATRCPLRTKPLPLTQRNFVLCVASINHELFSIREPSWDTAPALQDKAKLDRVAVSKHVCLHRDAALFLRHIRTTPATKASRLRAAPERGVRTGRIYKTPSRKSSFSLAKSNSYRLLPHG